MLPSTPAASLRSMVDGRWSGQPARPTPDENHAGAADACAAGGSGQCAYPRGDVPVARRPPLRISVQEWLRRSIWPLEQRWVSAEFVRMGTQLYFAQPQRAGVTCMADMYFFPEESARNAPLPCPARCAPDAASRYTGSRAGTRCCERNRLAGAGQAGRSDCGQPATPRRLLEVAGNADITDSWVGGDAVLEQGRSRTLDIDELRDRARFWSERLQQEANQ